MARSCSNKVWVGPAKTAPGVAIWRAMPGRKAPVEFLRFAKAASARRFVRAIVKHERACFVPTEQMRRLNPRR